MEENAMTTAWRLVILCGCIWAGPAALMQCNADPGQPGIILGVSLNLTPKGIVFSFFVFSFLVMLMILGHT